MSNKKTKVLVIDDEVSLEKVYSGFLAKLNCEVEFQNHPQKGWKSIDQTTYDLIITDLKMPIIAGDEFISIVRSSRLNAHTPIILSSAHIERPVMAELSRQSKVYFLNKPFDSQQLIELVSKVIGVKGKSGKGSEMIWESFRQQIVKQFQSHGIEIESQTEHDSVESWNVESVLCQYVVFDDSGVLNLSLLMKTKTFLDVAGTWQGTHYSELESESFMIWDQILSKCFKENSAIQYSKVIGHQFIWSPGQKKPLLQIKTSFGEILIHAL